MTGFTAIKENALLFQKMLDPILSDPIIESWQLALALDWAEQENLEFIWFYEDGAGIVQNGLTVVDKAGKALWSDIAGFEDKDDKLLQEALNAHLLMHKLEINWNEYK